MQDSSLAVLLSRCYPVVDSKKGLHLHALLSSAQYLPVYRVYPIRVKIYNLGISG